MKYTIKRELKIIFEGDEDLRMLRAVKELVGGLSESYMENNLHLTPADSFNCAKLFSKLEKLPLDEKSYESDIE